MIEMNELGEWRKQWNEIHTEKTGVFEKNMLSNQIRPPQTLGSRREMDIPTLQKGHSNHSRIQDFGYIFLRLQLFRKKIQTPFPIALCIM